MRGYRGYGLIKRGTARALGPVAPRAVPRKVTELPPYVKPAKRGKAHYRHWTEEEPAVVNSIRTFAKEVLGFRRARVYQEEKYTGRLDVVVVDQGHPSRPCAGFEIKAAREFKVDVHAWRRKWTRGKPKRTGTFEINPQQHIDDIRAAGVCSLYYVLVPVRKTRRPRKRTGLRETVEHVSICNLPMIEDAIGTTLKARRAITREVAWRCPTVEQWIEWSRRR